MKLHEYQAHGLFENYGITVGAGGVARTLGEARALAVKIGIPVVVKAQVLSGGRGKAGGVKIARSLDEVERSVQEILALTIKNYPVDKVLITKAVTIKKEYYLGVIVDRTIKKISVIASEAGGVDIEELAQRSPERILTIYLDHLLEPDQTQLDKVLLQIFREPALIAQARNVVLRMLRLFIEKDCSLVEINPYALVDDDVLMALDAKITIDDNAMFRHPELEKLRNPEEYSSEEMLAREFGLSFVSLDGDIGCVVNGAGLAMATMDMIKLFGGDPANFLDVGGSSSPEKVLNAFKILLKNQKMRAILINIFGGITRCDDIARGILMARDQIDIDVPLVIRLIGTNEREGRDILEKAGLVTSENLTTAVQKVLESK